MNERHLRDAVCRPGVAASGAEEAPVRDSVVEAGRRDDDPRVSALPVAPLRDREQRARQAAGLEIVGVPLAVPSVRARGGSRHGVKRGGGFASPGLTYGVVLEVRRGERNHPLVSLRVPHGVCCLRSVGVRSQPGSARLDSSDLSACPSRYGSWRRSGRDILAVERETEGLPGGILGSVVRRDGV